MQYLNPIRTLLWLSILGAIILLPGRPVSAQTSDMPTCQDSITLEHFKIDFIGTTDNGNGTLTYGYAVTANPEGNTGQNALSHWGLQLCDWFFDYDENLAPQPNTTYETPGEWNGETGREGVLYDVDSDDSSSLPFTWLKWNTVASDGLGAGGASDTDLFTVTVSSSITYEDPDQGWINVNVETGPLGTQVKAGMTGTAYGTGLCGPWADCDNPTSVCFTGFEAKPTSFIGWVLDFLGLK